MNINIDKIKKNLEDSGKKSIEINETNQGFYFEADAVERILQDKKTKAEVCATLKENKLSLRAYVKKHCLMIGKLSEKSGQRATGFAKIFDTKNNGNFEEVLRLAREADKQKIGLTLTKDYVVELTKHNSDLVEELVETNDTYSFPFAKYVFKGICADKGNSFPERNKKFVEGMIRVIDRDNSTQVWQHDKDRIKKMAEYIVKPSNKFWTRLEAGDISLVEELVKGSYTAENKSNLISLSSKVCKYLLEYKTKKQDSYFISDYFVRRALPFYCNVYGIKIDGDNVPLKCTLFKYSKYDVLFKVLKALQEKINEGKDPKKDKSYLNKHRIDHILWFCYRNGSEVAEKKRKAASGK